MNCMSFTKYLFFVYSFERNKIYSLLIFLNVVQFYELWKRGLLSLLVRFFGGAGGAHAGGGPILRLIIDVFDDTDPVLLLQVVLEESPKSPYSCFGISSGGLI